MMQLLPNGHIFTEYTDRTGESNRKPSKSNSEDQQKYKSQPKCGNRAENIEAFCITICRNLALDRIARSEQANQSLEGNQIDSIDASRSPEEQLIHDDRLQRVHQLFNALPERMRTALQLRDIEGMSYAEAAKAMDLSEDLFKVTLHRARKAIKTQYEKIENYGL